MTVQQPTERVRINATPEPAYAGYRYGLRQQAVLYSFGVGYKGITRLDLLDDWLRETFRIPEPAFRDAPGHDGSPRSALAAWSWRILQLGAELLRAANVPAFDAGRVVDVVPVEGEPGRFTITLAIPCVDHLPQRVVLLAFQQATRVASQLLGAERTPDNVRAVFASLGKELLDPLDGFRLGGASTIPLLRAVSARDIPFWHLGAGHFRLGWGRRSLRIARGAVHTDSALGQEQSQDKWLAANVLRDAGLPAPVHRLVGSAQEAVNVARLLGWPLVVKPADRDRGEGVTVAIADEARLAEAYRVATTFSRRVLVERQVSGVCHRVLVAEGKVVLASKRLPKSVRGDGRSTVRQLVDRANAAELAKPPWVRLKPFPLDDAAIACLASRGLAPDSVPKEGELAPLRIIQSTAAGGVVEELIDAIHPDNVSIAVRAARALGLSLAGVDIISDDISRPWHENGAIINEVNYSSLMPQDDAVLGQLLKLLIEEDGRIPVEVVVGGSAAWTTAEKLRAAQAERGLRTWITSHAVTLSPEGTVVAQAPGSLFGRCVALLANPQVEALVVVAQSDEWLRSGLPFDRVTSVTVEPGTEAPWLQELLDLLESYRSAP
ncbi:MAG: hypothetical protein GC201_15090 [Alphaproteobacteria bacterium]|nr:hypothetical protein [Alphaproteobacteria bacterium]